MNSYTLNTESAKKADAGGSQIMEKGAYIGQITRAEPIVSPKGTEGIDFSFKADTGEIADYLTIWTHRKDGTEIFGNGIVMALMTCLSVRNLKAENGVVEKYSKALGKKETVTTPVFKELMGKPVGLLLRMEEYVKSDGTTNWKPVIAGSYNKDGFTATEIIAKSPKAEALSKKVEQLRDKPLKAEAASSTSDSQGHGFADLPDDDLNF